MKTIIQKAVELLTGPGCRATRPMLAVMVVTGISLVAALLLATAAVPSSQAADAQKPVPALAVTALLPQRVLWTDVLEVTGPIAPWQEAVVGAQVGGLRLSEVRANVGDAVKRGQLLARFEADTLRTDEAQLLAGLAQASAIASQADANHRRALELKGGGSLSDQDVLRAETEAKTTRAQEAASLAQLASKRLQLRYADVIAPDSGTISARSATLGAVGNSGQELFRLIRQNRLEWRGELTASQLARVDVGQSVMLRLPNGRTASAKVRQIAPTFDSHSRLTTAYADVEPTGFARAGMYASGRIVLAQRSALIVPAASVVVRDGHSFVVKLGGVADIARATLHSVTVGRRQGGDVEIVQGLNEGERVAGPGAGLIGDGDTVRIAAPSISRGPTVSSVAARSMNAT